jgi:hypothetical protein
VSTQVSEQFGSSTKGLLHVIRKQERPGILAEVDPWNSSARWALVTMPQILISLQCGVQSEMRIPRLTRDNQALQPGHTTPKALLVETRLL